MTITAAQPIAKALASALDQHTLALGLRLSDAQKEAFLDYLGLLGKWNAIYNLTAIRDPFQMLTTHLIDSLAIVESVRKLGIGRLLDVGSGAGFPGIVLAIALPELSVTSVDAVQKKISFQTQVKAALRLDRLRPMHARIEALTLDQVGGPFDAIVSRAFATVADMVQGAKALLAPEGVFIAMKGQRPDAELAELGPDWAVRSVDDLKVPGLNAQRCLVVIEHARDH